MGAQAPPWMSTPVSMGTTIMAVAYDGGVVLGADSRTSAGGFIVNCVSEKLSPITENIYVCRSGSAADTQAVANAVRNYVRLMDLQLGGSTVKTAASLFQSVCYNNKNRLTAGLIVAGWDKKNGGSVYGIPIGGACIKVPYAVGGSGSSYIYGFLDSNWKEGMTREECQAFVIKAVHLAYQRDSSSGGVVRTVTIDKDGATKEMFHGATVPPDAPII